MILWTRRLVCLSPAALLAALSRFDAKLETQIEEAVNREREKEGLRPLRTDIRLRDAARSHSSQMDRLRFFSHVDPKYGDPGERLEDAGIRWRAVAENIYQSGGIGDPVRSAVRGWMRSPGHRRNILSISYTHAGVGVVDGPSGVVTITQIFAAFSP